MGTAILTGQAGVSIKPSTVQGYTLLADTTVSGSAVTTVTFSGLDIRCGDEVVLVSDIYNPTGSDTSISLYTNNNTTATSYYKQTITIDGTSVTSGRTNSNEINYIQTTNKNMSYTNIKLTNSGYYTNQSFQTLSYTTTLKFINTCNTSTFTMPYINRLDITSSVVSAIGIGSRFQLYKIQGVTNKRWVTT